VVRWRPAVPLGAVDPGAGRLPVPRRADPVDPAPLLTPREVAVGSALFPRGRDPGGFGFTGLSDQKPAERRGDEIPRPGSL
jgi:hypothetical protein